MLRVMLVDDEESALDMLDILLREMEGVQIVGRYFNPLQALAELEQVNDGKADSNPATVTVTITAPNAAPVAPQS